MQSNDKTLSALKVQSGRFKRLLDDVKYYKTELSGFTKQHDILTQAEAENEETAYKLKHVQNQYDETIRAIDDCINRAGLAQNDLRTALNDFPTERRQESAYQDSLKIYIRSSEIDLEYDEGLVEEYLKQ